MKLSIEEKAHIRNLRILWRKFDKSTAYSCAQTKTEFSKEVMDYNWKLYNDYIETLYGWRFE